MGVTGLWKLIEPAGKPIGIETLEDKVIVIDISIWLHQVTKGFTDSKGGQIHNAHLLGLFNRICKLLYFRVKPIFVFDGKACNLKFDTIAKRAQQKSKLKSESDKIEELLLQSLAREKVVKEALGADTKELTLSPLKKKPVQESKDDLYKLPPGLSPEKLLIKTEEAEEDFSSPKKSYNVNINSIDLKSSYFKSLAPDIRHEILIDIKETRKQNTWGRLKELPVESQDFSTYQMSGLLRRRQVQVSLEEAEKEMGGKVFSLSELESLLAEDGILEVGEKHGQRIAGDEHTRFLLVRDIKKAIDEAKAKELIKSEPQPGTSASFKEDPSTFEDDEYDLELQRAIQMSLETEETTATEDSGPTKLNAAQRKKFVGSFQSHGLVKGFMKEYGEMNDDDIKDLINATQVDANNSRDDSLTQKFPNTDRYVLYGTPEKSQSLNVEKSPNEKSAVEQVDQKEDHTIKKELVITIDSESYKEEEDIFADIFDSKKDRVEPKKSPDIEIASISDDDTVEYEISDSELQSKDFEQQKEPEIQKIDITNDSDENDVEFSENEKFWDQLNQIEKEYKTNLADVREKTPERKFPQSFDTQELVSKQVDLDEAHVPSEENLKEVLLKVSGDDQAEKVTDKFTRNIVDSEKSDRSSNEMPVEMSSTELATDHRSQLVEESKAVHDKQLEIVAKKDEESELITQKIVDKIEQLESEPESTPIAPTTAQILRTQMTDEELLQMSNDIKNQQKDLQFERNKLDRFGTSITATMSRECKELLKLFGIPYINAPTEAEAQCAFLNAAKVADGIITDDSDVWLFGARTVYKNFFLQKKVVKKFEMEDIEMKFKLDRKKLIQLAMLVGSDYTVGINGIGAVTALEILAGFPTTPEEQNQTDIYQSALSSLRKFRDWFQNGKQENLAKKGLKSKLKNIEITSGFPNLNVVKAYLEPAVDKSLEEFSWGVPDEESIYEFTKIKLGWTRLKTKEILDPVLKRFKERKQKKMEDYFSVQLKKRQLGSPKLSKRVQGAIERMAGKVDDPEASPKKPEKKPRKRKTVKKTLKLDEKKEIEAIQATCSLLSEDDEPPEKKQSPDVHKFSPTKESLQKISDEGKVNAFSLLKSPQKSQSATPKSRKRKADKKSDPKPSTSKEPPKDNEEESLPWKKPPRIPDTKQVIPQREKDKKEAEANKQKAIEAFKKSKKGKK